MIPIKELSRCNLGLVFGFSVSAKMRTFLIAALCTSLAYAKPQYNYPAPTGSYGTPFGANSQGGTSLTGGGFAELGSGFGQSGGSAVFHKAPASASIAIPRKQSTGKTNLAQTQLTQTQTGSGFTQTGSGFTQTGSGFTQTGSGFGQNFGVQSGGLGNSRSGSIGGGGTLVQKHIYVHVAPPEPEEVRHRQSISAGQATRHYKIIFIKAPSYETYQQQIIQQQAQNEEKTLVYVLVKKPDEPADITIPTVAPTAPSKPEVYFIRYKAKSDAAAGIHLSGSGAGIGGASLSLSSGSSSNSQFNSASSIGLSTGDSSSSVSVGRPQTNYGPPGESGPY